MAEVVIDDILEQEPNSFQGLTKTTFLADGQTVYMFTKAGNEPAAGDKLDGDITQDKAGKNKFTKTKAEGFGRTAYTGPKAGVPAPKSGDQRESIEKQSSLKAAIEIVRDSGWGKGLKLEAYTDTVVEVASRLYRALPSIGSASPTSVDDALAAVHEIMPGSELA